MRRAPALPLSVTTATLPRLHPLALAMLCLCSAAQGQAATGESTGAPGLPAVTVTAPASRQPSASIAGLGDGPAWQQPVQAQTFSDSALTDAQATRLADLTKLDASTTDAYNTVGYWDYLTVRGFTLENAYNYRREGLPIDAETRLPLDNKAAVELLKGTSGMQSGVSAPGGLVNLLVKRPEGRVRRANLSVSDAGDALSGVDLSDRFGPQQAWGLRVNAATERLNTHIDNTRGHRQLLAVAMDHRLAPGQVLELEYEHSDTSQPSVPGLSLLGDRLPSVREFDAHLNLNNQPWSLPVEMQGDTGTVRLRNDWGQGWHSTLTYGEQRLKSNDRAAFPFGCTTQPDYSDYLGDRYCADGRFDLYDYRSEDELRLTRALLAQVRGQLATGSVRHDLTLGVLRAVHLTDVSTQAYNYVGTGSLADPYAAFPPAPTPGTNVADRHERSTEWQVQDALTLSPQWQAWLGLRYTQLHRDSVATGGTEPTVSDARKLSTPWAALAYTFAPQTRAYLSWGEGMELETAPYGGTVSNPGQILPTVKSRQFEMGVKGQYSKDKLSAQWGLNWFHVHRPEAATVGGTFVLDGVATHQGLEGYWQGRMGAWQVAGSAMVLDASRHGSADATVNGKAPVNVPRHTVKLSSAYTWATAWPLTLQADVVHEGTRWVDPANTIRLPDWTRVDLGLRATQAMGAESVTWRLGITNLLNNRAWRESPTSFGHIYLFPMAPRTVTVSAQLDF